MRAERRVSFWYVGTALVSMMACLGSKPVLEQVSPTIPGAKFKVIATIAADDAGPSLNMTATVRQTLNDSGWTAVPRAGRWEAAATAIMDVCADAGTDGVLVVAYDRLELTDCASQRPAYRIDASYERGVGLTEMTKRFMRYLRGEPTTRPPR
jgi:hypothetical protein